MAELLIEEDVRHISDQDMAELLDAFTDIGITAAPAPPEVLNESDQWVLVLRWLGDESERVAFEVAAATVIDKICKRYQDRAAVRDQGQAHTPVQVPPRRIDVYGPRGELLKSVEVLTSE